jgi:hypothetical protein
MADYLCKTLEILIPVNIYHDEFNMSLGQDLFLSFDLRNDYVRELTGALAFCCVIISVLCFHPLFPSVFFFFSSAMLRTVFLRENKSLLIGSG